MKQIPMYYEHIGENCVLKSSPHRWIPLYLNLSFGYDGNGNLTADLNRGIAEITYNVLNLPKKIVFADGTSTEYTYSHDGRKLRTVRNAPGLSSVTDYFGNVVYRDGKADLLLVEGGYVTLADGVYHFYLTDHQGNVRVVANEDGNMEEVNHYYPFGGLLAESGSIQPYKYNGKELDGTLQWYDYGARYYDASVVRWLASDPSAEKYPMYSTYVYCKDSPVLRIDPDGKDDYIISNRGNLIRKTITNENIDRVYLDKMKNKNIFISDKSFLSKMWDAQSKAYNSGTTFGSTTNLEDATRLFKLVADNTEVEWKLDVYKNQNKISYVLVTDHNTHSVENGSYAKKRTKTVGHKIIDIHSHPSQKSKSASTADMRNLNGDYNAVYFKKDATLHEYNAKSSNLNTIQITKWEDLKKYIQYKLYK